MASAAWRSWWNLALSAGLERPREDPANVLIPLLPITRFAITFDTPQRYWAGWDVSGHTYLLLHDH